VHALVSWYDTPGLVSLEAAMAGCRIVTTDRGSAREYFGSTVDYCDPADPESIRRAVVAAWERPKPARDLQRLVYRNYCWERAARATLRGYQLAMGRTPLPEA
jgi:glycosyltransferase involved in cell wall biosynthesis